MAKRKANKKTTLTAQQVKTYFRAVEKVNRQLRRLKAHEREKGGHITEYAYRVLMADIKQFFGEGHTRFSTADVPRDMRSYIARMNAIENFYKMPTSTLTGEKEVYSKRAITLSAKIGVPLTADQLRKIFESGLYDQLSEIYGSATTLEVIGELEQQKDELRKQVDKGEIITFSGEYSDRLNEEELDEEFNDVLLRYLKG